jgi:hypothetical protein
MSNPVYHAKSSARKYGGIWEDYYGIHAFMDSSKACVPDARHRSMFHHSFGIYVTERVFGPMWKIESTGREVPTRQIAEQHVMEDCGGKIPTMSDWLDDMALKPWMAKGAKSLSKEFESSAKVEPNE